MLTPAVDSFDMGKRTVFDQGLENELAAGVDFFAGEMTHWNAGSRLEELHKEVLQYRGLVRGLLFALASAIVADKGGLLSHGAIIARELKVPTIVDVQGATHSIQDGDLVIVDANTGTVSIKGPGGGRA